jgi:hypothetical protein
MIQTVKKNYINSQFENYKVTLIDNSVLWVPHDTANRHYQEILEWVANGGTIVDNGE